jgi:hypothetical protein
MMTTYIRVEFTRHFRDGYNLIFALLLPAAMYILFGNIPSYTALDLGAGNVKFYLMISMAAYGAAVSTVAIAGTVATETMQGWGRQIALTKMPPAVFVGSKMIVAATVAGISAAIVFTLGAATGAQVNEPWIWGASYLIVLLGAMIFACYGIGVGMVFKSESALGLASGLMVFFAFLRKCIHAPGRRHAGCRPFHPDVRLRRVGTLPAAQGYARGSGDGAGSIVDANG